MKMKGSDLIGMISLGFENDDDDEDDENGIIIIIRHPFHPHSSIATAVVVSPFPKNDYSLNVSREREANSINGKDKYIISGPIFSFHLPSSSP